MQEWWCWLRVSSSMILDQRTIAESFAFHNSELWALVDTLSWSSTCIWWIRRMSLLFLDHFKTEVDAAIKVEKDLDCDKKWSIQSNKDSVNTTTFTSIMIWKIVIMSKELSDSIFLKQWIKRFYKRTYELSEKTEDFENQTCDLCDSLFITIFSFALFNDIIIYSSNRFS